MKKRKGRTRTAEGEWRMADAGGRATDGGGNFTLMVWIFILGFTAREPRTRLSFEALG